MRRKNGKKPDRHFSQTVIVFGFMVAAAACVFLFCAFLPSKVIGQGVETQNPVRGLEQKSGFIRTVGQEEFPFYQQIVAHDAPAGINYQKSGRSI